MFVGCRQGVLSKGICCFQQQALSQICEVWSLEKCTVAALSPSLSQTLLRERKVAQTCRECIFFRIYVHLFYAYERLSCVYHIHAWCPHRPQGALD